MICNKCKSKWETDRRISASLISCPFCGERLTQADEDKPQAFDNTKDALIFIAQKHGNEVLLGKKLKAFFHDYAPQVSPNRKSLVFAVYEKGAASILKSHLNAKQADKEIAFKRAVAKLSEAFVAQDAAENIVREFAEALGWQLSAAGKAQQDVQQALQPETAAIQLQTAQTKAQPQPQSKQSQSQSQSTKSPLSPSPPPLPNKQQGRKALAPVLILIVALALVVGLFTHNKLNNDTNADAEASSDTDTIVEMDGSVDKAIAEILGGGMHNIKFGGYDWRVLDIQGDKALLLTEDVIERCPYNTEYVDVTWESCTLRKYLNGEFLNKFSSQEQEMILETTNTNLKNQWYDTDGGNSTTDKVFLLSIDEVVKYFGDNGDLANRKGWYVGNEGYELRDGAGYYISDQYNNERVAKYEDDGAWWWLRSPGFDSDYAAHVSNVGVLLLSGYNVLYDRGGVRPALWLNLKS
ncbi:MAG: DUF6273 domain-containing protein [Clostridiales Family XIII bacterium]|jgi:hypothetical protein|nr:DUF6273 domain-containing protein [Clostridiales Family XIII bacterium]